MLISIQEYFVKLLHSFVTSFIVKFPMKVPLNVFLLNKHKKYFSSQEMFVWKQNHSFQSGKLEAPNLADIYLINEVVPVSLLLTLNIF